MRRILYAAVVAGLLAGAAMPLSRAGSDETVEVQGFVVDKWCGGANANVEGKGCVIACNKKGASLVFHSERGKTYGLSDQKVALAHVGRKVRVEATLDDDGVLTVKSWSDVVESEPREKS
jgi:hypothetical protein